MSLEGVRVKEEREGGDSAGGGVSEAAARAGLYDDHEVKGDLVLGPECLQPPDLVYAFHAEAVAIKEECKLWECDVKIERLTDHEAPAMRPTSPATAQHQSRATHDGGALGDTDSRQTSDTLQPQTTHTYQCDTCGKIFKHKFRLIKHIQFHPHNISKTLLNSSDDFQQQAKQYPCNICNKQFKKFSHLNSHKRVHAGEKPYTCEICKKQFTHINNCIRHKRVHNGDKPYVCNVCNKQFSRSGHLKDHMKVHTGERPYTCDLCEKQFSRLENLNVHKRTHTGVRPYSCDICNKKFPRFSNLNIHRRVHTGEKPFSCETCGKQYSHRCNLKIHQNKRSCGVKGKKKNCNPVKSMKSSFDKNGELASSAN